MITQSKNFLDLWLYRFQLEIGWAELILRRRNTSVAYIQAKFDKSVRNNYTMAGKLAIADDYYLARWHRGWFITRASYFRGWHTSNLVRMGNTDGIDTARSLNRPSSPPPLRWQDYIRTYPPCSSVYLGPAIRVARSYSRQLINLARCSSARPPCDYRRAIVPLATVSRGFNGKAVLFYRD